MSGLIGKDGFMTPIRLFAYGTLLGDWVAEELLSVVDGEPGFLDGFVSTTQVRVGPSFLSVIPVSAYMGRF